MVFGSNGQAWAGPKAARLPSFTSGPPHIPIPIAERIGEARVLRDLLPPFSFDTKAICHWHLLITIIMKRYLFLLFFSAMTTLSYAADTESPVYELRTYYAAPGKLDDLHARFRDHTMKILEKHGMTNIGYWVPLENPDGKLIYMIAFPSRDAAKKSWKEFGGDPEWQAAPKTSETKRYPLTLGQSGFLTTNDYFPGEKTSP